MMRMGTLAPERSSIYQQSGLADFLPLSSALRFYALKTKPRQKFIYGRQLGAQTKHLVRKGNFNIVSDPPPCFTTSEPNRTFPDHRIVGEIAR